MNTDINKAIMHDFLKELDKSLNAVDQFFAPDCLAHLPGTLDPVGREDFKSFVGMLYDAFPDLHHVVDDQVAEGDKVVTLVTARGTHKGVFQSIVPTGRGVIIRDIIVVRLQEGKVAELWAQFDALGVLQQLGAGQPTLDSDDSN